VDAMKTLIHKVPANTERQFLAVLTDEEYMLSHGKSPEENGRAHPTLLDVLKRFSQRQSKV
jgi:hypothetical protein